MGVVIIAVSLILIFYPRESAESVKETSNQVSLVILINILSSR